LFGRVKAGHTGTLDPLATGLLPLCLGEATKFAGGLLEADKTYEAVIRLGLATTTGDAEGAPVFEGDATGCAERLPEVLSSFVGDIEQLPPMFSALKHQGRPLYSYARAGEEIARTPRRVTIRNLELLFVSGQDVTAKVRCSKGTYIRTLAHDIGERLGCGAHVAALRRIAIGRLSVDAALSLDALTGLSDDDRARCLLPSDLLLADLPAVVVDGARAEALSQGRPVAPVGPTPYGPVRLYAENGTFLGLGIGQEDGMVLPRRMRVQRPSAQVSDICDAA
jgi:tRNA pseudouridine55 synthase